MDASRGATERSWSRRQWVSAALVFAISFTLRSGLLLASDDRAWPHSLRFEGDAPTWARWANALARGQAFEFDLPVRTPGVAFALQWLGFTHAPFTAAKVLWSAVGAAACAGLWAVLARVASHRVAWIAAGWLALSNPALQLATSLNNEGLYAALIVALLAVELDARTRPRAANSALCGLVHALASLLRAEHLLLVAFLALLEVFERRRLDLRRWTIIAAVFLATCAPWAWRSHLATVRFNRDAPRIDFARSSPSWTDAARAELARLPAFAREGNFAFLSHLARQQARTQVDAPDVRAYFEREWGYTPEPLPEWTLVSSKAALDFALANHPLARGGFSRAALSDGRDEVPEFSFGRPSHLRLYLHGFELGWSWIREAPGRWREACLEKLARFWAGASGGLGADNWPHDAASTRHAVDLSIAREPSRLWSVALLIAIAVGSWSARRTSLGRLLLAVLLYKLAVCLAFYGYARQAASIAPVTCALGALGIARALDLVPARIAPTVQRGAVLAGLLALLATGFTCFAPAKLRPTVDPGRRGVDPLLGVGAFEQPADLELQVVERR